MIPGPGPTGALQPWLRYRMEKFTIPTEGPHLPVPYIFGTRGLVT